MSNYIDGFAFPIHRDHLTKYKQVAEAIADIWKEHGALGYFEYVSDGLEIEGTLSFSELLENKVNEATIFGWVLFESRESRDRIHKLVAEDPRMPDLMKPLVNGADVIFDAQRMACAGFQSFIER